ncbi:MAG TPA: aminoacyl-tRNA hydrolase [Methyloceanibacter sp.]|jgi:peptidyl-tRNA hydrolase, PTH1 family|nr:aminoacyl-tRNA hydrolase [Methyloceanibacter sp.]
MKLFVGLGNPGAEYAFNRHNVGFMAADAIAATHGFPAWRKRFQGVASEGKFGREQVMLLKPQTYMNESGRSVGEAVRFYKLDLDDVVVFHDELDLVPGKVRVKAGGGVAGHNGLRSITAHIGNDYVRVRIGIGHPGSRELVKNWVLHDFVKSDRDWLEPLLGAVAKAAPDLAEGGNDKFQSFVAHAMHMEAEAADELPVPAPRGRRDSPSSESEKPTIPEGPFGKLRRWFGA